VQFAVEFAEALQNADFRFANRQAATHDYQVEYGGKKGVFRREVERGLNRGEVAVRQRPHAGQTMPPEPKAASPT